MADAEYVSLKTPEVQFNCRENTDFFGRKPGQLRHKAAEAHDIAAGDLISRGLLFVRDSARFE
jgi:hypothetical protein